MGVLTHSLRKSFRDLLEGVQQAICVTEGGNFGGLITPILVRLFDMQPPFAHDTNHQRRPAYPNHTLMDQVVVSHSITTASTDIYDVLIFLLAPKASEASWGLSIFSSGSKWLLMCVCEWLL